MTTLPARPVDVDWLALREPADAGARDAAADVLLPPLLRRLPGTGLRVVDLGAGTGANRRWLAPRLPGEQHWTLVDHDPRLQDGPARGGGPARVTTVRADVADLDHLLTGTGGTDLVTASALLDLLDAAQLDAVARAVAGHRVPALFSLNVTGEVVFDPADPLDADLATAFDAHQRRDGRLGPDAGDAVSSAFERLGWDVVRAPTPWRLGPGALLDAYRAGRVEPAVEWTPSLAGAADAWLRRPVRGAFVGHVDVLALPPGPRRRPR